MKYEKGFILPIVLALATIASMTVVTCWWVTGLQVDIVIQRELWYKNLYATQQLMNDGLRLVQKQFDKLTQRLNEKKGSVVWEMGKTGPHEQGDASQAKAQKLPRLSATISVMLPKQTNRSTDQLVLGVISHNAAGQPVCTMRCVVTKLARTTVKGKEFRFVVSHFTIDTSV